MARQPPGVGDDTADLDASLSGLCLSDGTLDVGRLDDSRWTYTDQSDCEDVTWRPDYTTGTTLTPGGGSEDDCRWTYTDQSDCEDVTWRPDYTTGTTLTPGGGSEDDCLLAADRRAPRFKHGGHDLSTTSKDAESTITPLTACGDDVCSVLSRWSDFVSSDDDYLTADEGGVCDPVSAPELFRRLQANGDDPGPITDSTAAVYRRRLARLEARVSRFSPELDAALVGAAPASALEVAAFEAAALTGPALRRSCFNYLLLDPRVTAQRSAGGQVPFSTFVSAVFYVGKGQQSRPYSHLVEAAAAGPNSSAKVAHIRAVWRSGAGVTLLNVFHHRTAAEALTREAAIIDALGLRNLTNERRGHYYGPAKAWSSDRRRSLGVALLHRAWRVFIVEGEAQLRPEDIGR